MSNLIKPSRPDLNWDAFQNIQKPLYHLIEKQGKKVVKLDLSGLQRVFPNGAVPLIVLLAHYRQAHHVAFEVIPPTAYDCLRLMNEQNYLHYLSGGNSQYPLTRNANALHRFTNDGELNDLINEQIHQILERATYAEGVLQSFEWALNEIAGNVLVHAGTEAGWLQVVVHPNVHHMAIAVADGGKGIPENIRAAFPEFIGGLDADAIAHALKKGITSRPDFGQGKGLTGSLEIAKHNQGGRMSVHSLGGKVEWSDGKMQIKADFPPFQGTLVDIQLDTTQPIAIEEALWGRAPSFPFNENFYGQTSPNGEMLFHLVDEASSFGNRPTGVKIRNKIENLLITAPSDVLIIDLSSIDLIASSFADEVFGKLVSTLGFTGFMTRIRLININKFCRGIIDDVVQSRIAQSRTPQNDQ